MSPRRVFQLPQRGRHSIIPVVLALDVVHQIKMPAKLGSWVGSQGLPAPALAPAWEGSQRLGGQGRVGWPVA
jgi:hypothetical protein